MSNLNIAFLQFEPVYLEPQQNRETVARLLKDVSADLVVLPELFATGYFFKSAQDLEAVAEPIPDGPTVDWLRAQARQSGAVWVAGLPEKAGKDYYNSAVAVTPEGVCHNYRKIHLYYEEKVWFKPGDLGFQVVDLTTRAGVEYRLGVMVCFDWYFPESARTLALKGADVIAHPSNLVRKGCPGAMPVRALENRVYTITANRTGEESNGREVLRFIGKSLLCSPRGEVLLQAPSEGAFVGVQEIDLALARDRQLTVHNHLFDDRRPQYYTGRESAD